jgi:hypothetical protein
MQMSAVTDVDRNSLNPQSERGRYSNINLIVVRPSGCRI